MWIKLPSNRLLNANKIAEIQGYIWYVRSDVDADLPKSERRLSARIDFDGETVLELEPSLETPRQFKSYMDRLEDLAKGETSFVDLSWVCGMY